MEDAPFTKKSPDTLITNIRIPAGYYAYPEEFVERVNLAIREAFTHPLHPSENLVDDFGLTFIYDRFTKLVSRRMTNLRGCIFLSNSPIFQPALALESVDENLPDSKLFNSSMTAKRRSRLDTTTTLFIYSDIIK